MFLTRYLMALGVPEDIAAVDACNIEHGLSDITFQRMRTHIQHCAYDCPHAPQRHFLEFNNIKIRDGRRKRTSQ